MSRIANCPNCGAQVEFKAGTSLLAVCRHCSSAVARVGDDITELEILGKVAPLAALSSPLSLGARGAHARRSFTLVGRLQLDYGLGPWNEWYAAFDDGTWGWVAEAQGRVYLTFGRALQAGLPDFGHWRVGTDFKFAGEQLVVVERRKATFVAAEGELPFAVAPGSEFRYCDLEGPNGTFGTLDFGTGTALESIFLGHQLSYKDLFPSGVLRDQEPSAAGGSVGLNCPNCGSGVELQAPDDAQRITCSACDSLLDCSKGSELFLISSEKRSGPKPVIPLGSVGLYQDKKYTVYGHLVRSVTVEGIKYYWEEYLLRGDDRGYRWLVSSDGHWSWVEPVSSGAVQIAALSATYQGQRFRHFQSASARVEALRGEFYWKVAVGDVASTADYVAPPRVLSREMTAEEVSWSLGTYLRPREVEEIFRGDKTARLKLARPHGVYLNQPNPHAAALKSTIRAGALFTALLFVLGMVFVSLADAKQIYQDVHLLPGLVGRDPRTGKEAEVPVVLSKPFQIEGGTNLEITVEADVDNSWLYVNGALINEAMNEVRAFGVEVSHYHGYSGGESWSEGAKKKTVYLGGMGSGSWILRLEPEWDRQGGFGTDKGKPPTRYRVRMLSDVFLPSHWLLMLLLLWLPPLSSLVRYFVFENQRWSESDHAGG